jgi:hypothetical protein
LQKQSHKSVRTFTKRNVNGKESELSAEYFQIERRLSDGTSELVLLAKYLSVSVQTIRTDFCKEIKWPCFFPYVRLGYVSSNSPHSFVRGCSPQILQVLGSSCELDSIELSRAIGRPPTGLSARFTSNGSGMISCYSSEVLGLFSEIMTIRQRSRGSQRKSHVHQTGILATRKGASWNFIIILEPLPQNVYFPWPAEPRFYDLGSQFQKRTDGEISSLAPDVLLSYSEFINHITKELVRNGPSAVNWLSWVFLSSWNLFISLSRAELLAWVEKTKILQC